MKNLKRALSLVLATVMVIGMMVVGASAAGYADLTDKDEIVNKEAVAVVSELGLIVGYNNKFMPDGTIDRAGMAKLICLALNGGKDPVLGTKDNPTYTDIDGHWAEAYIEYCSALGIINGFDGKFNPNGKITGTGAAKMLLTALGYKSDVEGFVGDAWEINTNVKANQVGLYKNLANINASANLTRDNAAQMVYNALNAREVYYSNPITVDGIVIGNSQLMVRPYTMLEQRFGVTKVEGVITANEWAVLDGDSDTALKAGLTRIENAEGIFEDGTVKTATFAVSTPVDMLGKTVTLYIKKATNLAKSEVVGTALVSDVNAVVTTGDGDLDELLKDNGLTTDKYTEFYHNYAEKAADKMNYKVGATLTAIDNDSDGVAEYVVNVEKELTEISAYNAKTEKLTVKGVVTDTFENVIGSEDVEKGDIVLAVQYGGRTYVELPETVTGEMTYYTTKSTRDIYMTVDGVKYHEDGLSAAHSSATKFYVADCDDDGVQFDATYTFYLDDYSNVIAFVETEAPAKNYALIVDSAYSINGLNMTAQVQLLLADGTDEVYDLDWDASVTNLFGKDQDDDMMTFLGSNDDNHGANAHNRGNAAGILVNYSIDEDGDVTLYAPFLNLASHDKDDAKLITSYDKTEYADGNTAWIDTDIKNGQTFFDVWENNTHYVYTKSDKTDGHKAIDTNNTRFGIDEETLVFYYNDKTGAYDVVVGYDAMYNTIVGKSEAVDAVMYNPSSFPNSNTGVANVLLITGEWETEKTYDYALVLDQYNNYKGYWQYDVILADGTITTLKSKVDNLKTIDGVDKMVYRYTTNADGWTDFDSVFTGSNTNYYEQVFKADGTTVDTANSTKVGTVIGGYDISFGYVYVPFAKWVQNFNMTTSNTKFWHPELANKNPDVIFNAFDVDMTAETAETIAFENGQQAVIVYEGNKVVAAWVIADKADDIVIDAPETTTGRMKSTMVDNIRTANAGDYSSYANAIENATVLHLSQAQADGAKIDFVFDNTTAFAGDVYSDSEVALSYSDVTTTPKNTSSESITKDFGNGNVIVFRTWNATEGARYSAYVIEIG